MRVIAASNRNLESEARSGQFRRDLYFRANVFPIQVAPLRERLEDIGSLTSHFMEVFCRRSQRPVPELTSDTIRQLERYDWPGNVRELRNVVERSLISGGNALLDCVMPFDARDSSLGAELAPTYVSTGRVLTADEFRELERDNLLRALVAADGRVYGPGGAAELLGIKPSTLSSRIKALGIIKPKLNKPRNGRRSGSLLH